MRLRAEEKLQMFVSKNLAQHLGECDDKGLLHELQVHMVELAMQNEELKSAHEAVEKAKDRYQALYDTAPICYLTIDKDGMIYEANRTAASRLKVSRDKLIGQYFQSFLERESADSLHLFLKKTCHRERQRVSYSEFNQVRALPSLWHYGSMPNMTIQAIWCGIA